MEGWVKIIDLLILIWLYKEVLNGDGIFSLLLIFIIWGVIIVVLLLFYSLRVVFDFLLVNRGF